jgi:NAD(P)-dependent dehydrogenase (short-subunit alcohol dehydrogenase family)
MPEPLDRPVAIITGAGRGIGRATAIELAAAGYRLTLVSRNEEELNETARLIEGGLVAAADVRSPDEVRQVVEGTLRHFDDRLDAVIHCAGIAPAQPIARMSPEQWRDVIETNLSAAFYLCHAAWPVFQRMGGGVVVNVSSFAARDPFPGFAAYGAAKAGLNLFGLSAAREGQAIGVRVHTVAPAAVETSMFRALLNDEQYPPEKALAPADVARVIAGCVRGELCYTSGEVIYLRKVVE